MSIKNDRSDICQVEVEDENAKATQLMLAKAIQECPASGIIWATAIELEKPAQKRQKATDALKR